MSPNRDAIYFMAPTRVGVGWRVVKALEHGPYHHKRPATWHGPFASAHEVNVAIGDVINGRALVRTRIEDRDTNARGGVRIIPAGTIGTVERFDGELYDIFWTNGGVTRWTAEELTKDADLLVGALPAAPPAANTGTCGNCGQEVNFNEHDRDACGKESQ